MATERTVLVRLKADTSSFVRGMGTAAAAVKGLTHEIDTTNDRTAWLAQSILGLGPALVPLGAAATPVLSGIATQMTVAAGAAGVAALAFVGVGDALTALNNYQVDPTDEHLKKLNETMARIGPQGEEFVHFLDHLTPKLHELQDTARAGIFPGVEEGITSFLKLMPQVNRIVATIASAIGDLSADAGAGLAGPKFRAFFDWLESDARPILMQMGHTLGNLTEGLANMLVSFAPLSRDFSSGLEGMSAAFAEWSRGLATNDSFQSFLDYVRESGPKAIDLLGSLVDALVAILHAAAPVGEVMLPMLTDFFEIIAKIADTPFGTFLVGAAAAMSIYGRAVALASVTTSGLGKAMFGALNPKVMRSYVSGLGEVTSAQDRARLSAAELTAMEEKRAAAMATGRRAIIRSGAAMAGMAIQATGLFDSMHLTNTASLALMGSLGGPWGTAIGGAVGALLDMKDAAAESKVDVNGLTETLDQQTGALTENSRAWAAKALNDIGGLEAAQKMGISLQQLTDAALGDKDQLAAVNAILDDHIVKLGQSTTGNSDLTGEQIELSHSASELKDALNDTNGELSIGRREIELTREAVGRVSTAKRALIRIEQRHKDAIQADVQAIKAQRNSARETANQFITLGDSLDDSKVSLHDWITELEKQAKALRNFRENAVEAANKGLRQGLIDALEAAGPAGALRMKQLANASEKEIARANAAWAGGRAEIGRYARAADGVPNNIPIKVWVEQQQALQALAVIQARLNGLHDKAIHVDITRTDHTGVDFISGGGRTSADGSTVPKSGLPYRDRYPYLLADGEEVISNRYGQADRHRDLLKAINANRLADGGTAGARRYTTSITHTERIVERLPRTIVLRSDALGDVVIDTVDDRIHAHARREEEQAG